MSFGPLLTPAVMNGITKRVIQKVSSDGLLSKTQEYITNHMYCQFTYLGTQINAQNKRSEEIRKRIQAGNRHYYANKK